jgi:hypothetical protein
MRHRFALSVSGATGHTGQKRHNFPSRGNLQIQEMRMDLQKIFAGTSVAIFLTIAFTSDSQQFSTFAPTARPAETKGIAVVPQYDTTHVYVNPQAFDHFVASLIATFGGTMTKQGVFTVSGIMRQLSSRCHVR